MLQKYVPSNFNFYIDFFFNFIWILFFERVFYEELKCLYESVEIQANLGSTLGSGQPGSFEVFL